MRVAIAFAAAALLTAPAAASPVETHSITVGTSDLDLSSPAHRARLAARVGRAADKVCGGAHARGAAEHRAFRECRSAAVRDALGE